MRFIPAAVLQLSELNTDIWASKTERMPKNLVIVESPAKAKTIEGYLGKDYAVVSSYGHVRDLPKDDMAIDVDNGFKPTYEISKDKKEVIAQLKKMVGVSELIYLASDDDREGEAISWHLKEALNLDEEKTRRIVFREITKNAILSAIQSPRGIDYDLVNAQQARRVLDRLVGFELSPILWKKIKTGLSAGRVQSVAVRLVVEREREIERFGAESFYKIAAQLSTADGKIFKAEGAVRFPTEEEAEAYLRGCIGARFAVASLEQKPARKSPSPPFTTSTLQQEASRKLGFSVAQTMSVAQKLYEAGKISYMRTDSVALSQEALAGAETQILASFGSKYAQRRTYKSKNKTAQEAHEAIRPTDFSVLKLEHGGNEQRLYELIWKRAIASQMTDAQLERTIAGISVSSGVENLVAQGEMIRFDGFLKVYTESTDDDDANGEGKSVLPTLEVGQELRLQEMTARQSFSRPPARYTEASLVKKLEEMGIGRPSTYAPTITTIQKRDYIIKESREGRERPYRELSLNKDRITAFNRTEIVGSEKSKLFPTNMAMIVNDFLVNQFPNVIDFSFTAKVEEELDEIASGKIQWTQMIDNFYHNFKTTVTSSKSLARSDLGLVRELGIDPVSSRKVYARLGKFGPVIQIGENAEDEKPRFSSLKKNQLLESITLEEALDLFKLPRKLGEFEGLEIEANNGRFGPYLRLGNKFFSLPKGEEPMDLSLERAIEIIRQRRAEEASKVIKAFPEDPELQVLNGRFGPYLKAGKLNVKIPKGKKPEELTLEECRNLVQEAGQAPKKAPFRRGKSKK
jgi:DNA topoisomerase I